MEYFFPGYEEENSTEKKHCRGNKLEIISLFVFLKQIQVDAET